MNEEDKFMNKVRNMIALTALFMLAVLLSAGPPDSARAQAAGVFTVEIVSATTFHETDESWGEIEISITPSQAALDAAVNQAGATEDSASLKYIIELDTSASTATNDVDFRWGASDFSDDETINAVVPAYYECVNPAGDTYPAYLTCRDEEGNNAGTLYSDNMPPTQYYRIVHHSGPDVGNSFIGIKPLIEPMDDPVENNERVCFRVKAVPAQARFYSSSVVNVGCFAIEQALPPTVTASAEYEWGEPGDRMYFEASGDGEIPITWRQVAGRSTEVEPEVGSLLIPTNATHGEVYTLEASTRKHGIKGTAQASVSVRAKPIVEEVAIDGYPSDDVPVVYRPGEVVSIYATQVWTPQVGGFPLTYTLTQMAGAPVVIPETYPDAWDLEIPASATGPLTFRLVVASPAGQSAPYEFTVPVRAHNKAPTAHAGADQTVNLGETVILDATSSSDPEGVALYYAWTLVSGNWYDWFHDEANETTAKPAFTAPDNEGVLIFQVEVFDDEDLSDTDTVTVTVVDGNAFQTAVNTSTVEANPGRTVELVGYVRGNPPSDLYMAWFRDFGTHNENVGDGANLAYVVPRDARIGDVIVLYFHAASPTTRRESDTVVEITVVESPLSVNAGSDRTAAWEDTVTLTVAVSDEVAPVTYQWFQAHYPLLEVTGENTANLSFTVPDTAPAGTIYEFEVVVSDSTGASVRDSVNVEVSARALSAQVVTPLSVDAGQDQLAATGETVGLDATASGGTAPLTYRWEQKGGPTVAMPGRDTPSMQFVVPEGVPAGTAFTFTVEVTDAAGASAQDSVTVQTPATSESQQVAPLSVYAGSDRQASAGDTVNLSATASGGTTPLTYQWTQIGGASVSMSGASTAGMSFLVPDNAASGTVYTFKVVVSDSTGSAAEDSVSVGIAPASHAGQINPPATGQSQTLLPQNLLDLIRLLLGQTGGAMNITATSDGTITIVIPPGN